MLGKKLVLQAARYVGDQYRKLLDYRYRRVRSGQEREPKHLRLHPSVRKGYYFCIGLVSAILLLNSIVAIWAGTAHPIEEGLVVTLYRGSCSKTSVANFWVHLAINLIASALFAASTYIMQRLAAPTREDLDRAHRDGDSLRIGSLAITNFALLDWKRLGPFLLLWCSSLPTHLMYNGVVEQTRTDAETADYKFLALESAIPDAQFNSSVFWQTSRIATGFPVDQNYVQELITLVVGQRPPLQRLEIPECIEAYSSGASLDMGDVVLVVNSDIDLGYYETGNFSGLLINSPAYDQLLLYGAPWQWLCGRDNPNCNPAQITANGTWMWDDALPIDYCLARKNIAACELNMSLAMMIAVLVCSLGKLCAMLLGMLLSTDRPLITVGDAIASFLEREDESTKGLSVATSDHFDGFWDASAVRDQLREQAELLAQAERIKLRQEGLSTADIMSRTRNTPYTAHRAVLGAFEKQYQSRPWIKHTSRRAFTYKEMPTAYRWANIFGLTALGVACGFLGYLIREAKAKYSLAGYSFSLQTIWNIGIGNQPPLLAYIKYTAASSPTTSYISGAVLTNTPQLGLSALYLFYNNLFTRLSLSLEVTTYATRRRGLRVSFPVKNSPQRGSYFLQFPLRYSLIMITYFALAHTFLSESLFLRRSNTIWPTSFTDPDAIGEVLVSQIGYSILALFFLSIFLAMLVGVGFGIGLWRRDWILPVTNGNSRSISAMCHPPPGHEDVHLVEVRWGVTGMKVKEGEVVGHCSFSGAPVRMPQVGEKFF